MRPLRTVPEVRATVASRDPEPAAAMNASRELSCALAGRSPFDPEVRVAIPQGPARVLRRLDLKGSAARTGRQPRGEEPDI
jgi:hypothetical protein